MTKGIKSHLLINIINLSKKKKVCRSSLDNRGITLSLELYLILGFG